MALEIITPLLATPIAFLSMLYQIALWQRKEYRADRMRSFVFSPESNLPQHRWLLAAWVGVGISWLAYFFISEISAEIIAWVSLVAFLIHHAWRIKKVGIHQPKWTMKSITIIAVIMVVCATYITFMYIPGLLPCTQTITWLFFIPALCAAGVGVANIIFGLRKLYVAKKAAQKRSKLPHLKVVGITGSYGKTSTKYFLSQILSSAGRSFVATPKHCNSYYCIAQHFLSAVSSDSSLYIAEMAAYRAGEIRQIGKMIKPTSGVITAVSNQHMSLFGSPEKLLDAKWELAQALPSHGVLVLNDDDNRLKKKAVSTTQKIIRYSTSHQADVWLENMNIHDSYVSGTIHIGPHSQTVRIPLVSSGLVECVLAAAAVASSLELEPTAITTAIEKLSPMPRTMENRRTKEGASIIDDSYSGGEHAALNAINHLKYFSVTHKRIAFVPIIELGPDAVRAHEAIGRAMAQANASIYIYGNAYQDAIKKGLGSHVHKATWFVNPVSFAEAVSAGMTNETALLLEGRVPSLVRQALAI